MTGTGQPETFAPDDGDIEALARATLARLGQSFAPHLDGVVLRIEEFADEETLNAMGIEDPFDLTGLYTGRTIGAVAQTGDMPATVRLFRRPLLDEWVETGVSLEALIAHVVIHEIGHHIGLSDADMHALETIAREEEGA